MARRFLFVLAAMSSLMINNTYAEAIKAKTSSSQDAQAATAILQPVTAENTTRPSDNPIKASLSLKQAGQRLYAYIIIEQPQAKNGKVRIDWTPPLHSSCDKSSYILSYQGKKFHTQAYRTLGYSLINGKSISCTGTWQADVKNKEGATLATAVIHIQSANIDAYAKMRSLAAIA